MKVKILKPVFVFVLVIAIAVLSTACSQKDNIYPVGQENGFDGDVSFSDNNSTSENSRDAGKTSKPLATSSGAVDNAAEEAMASQDGEPDGIKGTGYNGKSASLDILAQRKIIRNANITLEVENFNTAYGNLQAMIGGIGFIQDSNIHKEYYTYKEEKKSRYTGTITIRVDAKQFDRILNDIKGLGDVLDDKIYSTDVTDQYFDTEGRKKILQIEYDSLVEYMKTLKDPTQIFNLRLQMADLSTEIERLTGTLNKWKDLVELSTVYIQINEKYPEDMNEPKEDTFIERMKESIKNSFSSAVKSIGDLVIFIIEAIPTLLILAIIVLIGFRIFRKVQRKKKEKAVPAKEE